MSEINIRPIEDRVVIQQMDAKTQTESGIYIPEIAQEKPKMGTVLAVGVTNQIKKGDTVLFGKYGGTPITYGDKEYLIMREGDVYCIVE